MLMAAEKFFFLFCRPTDICNPFVIKTKLASRICIDSNVNLLCLTMECVWVPCVSRVERNRILFFFLLSLFLFRATHEVKRLSRENSVRNIAPIWFFQSLLMFFFLPDAFRDFNISIING